MWLFPGKFSEFQEDLFWRRNTFHWLVSHRFRHWAGAKLPKIMKNLEFSELPKLWIELDSQKLHHQTFKRIYYQKTIVVYLKHITILIQRRNDSEEMTKNWDLSFSRKRRLTIKTGNKGELVKKRELDFPRFPE